MVVLGSLWLPILLSAVLVFIVSSIVWMALPWHRADYRALPDEDAVLRALRGQELEPGQYDFPHLPAREELKKPEVQRRFQEGPVGFFTLASPGFPNTARNLGIWLLFLIAVSGTVAYVASRTLPPGTEYLRVFQITGTVAWAAYGFGMVQDAIWFARPWSFVAKHLVDSLIYGLVTAGVFGWLWPV